jgi:hypothetical protein
MTNTSKVKAKHKQANTNINKHSNQTQTHIQFIKAHPSWETKAPEQNQKAVTVLDCIKLFSAEEKLSEQNLW